MADWKKIETTDVNKQLSQVNASISTLKNDVQAFAKIKADFLKNKLQYNVEELQAKAQEFSEKDAQYLKMKAWLQQKLQQLEELKNLRKNIVPEMKLKIKEYKNQLQDIVIDDEFSKELQSMKQQTIQSIDTARDTVSWVIEESSDTIESLGTEIHQLQNDFKQFAREKEELVKNKSQYLIEDFTKKMKEIETKELSYKDIKKSLDLKIDNLLSSEQSVEIKAKLHDYKTQLQDVTSGFFGRMWNTTKEISSKIRDSPFVKAGIAVAGALWITRLLKKVFWKKKENQEDKEDISSKKNQQKWDTWKKNNEEKKVEESDSWKEEKSDQKEKNEEDKTTKEEVKEVVKDVAVKSATTAAGWFLWGLLTKLFS